MAKKAEVQKEDEHENRNAVITGLLIALLPFVILLLWGWSATGFKSIRDICPSGCPAEQIQQYNQPVQNSTGGIVITQMASCINWGLCPFKVLLYGALPTIYMFICLPIGAVLYILSLSRSIKKFDAEHKFKVRFWAKSLLAGGVFGIVLGALMPLILNL